MKLLQKITQPFLDLYQIGFPNVCLLCKKTVTQSEKTICFDCIDKLPQTFHFQQKENFLHVHFQGRVVLESSAALYLVNKENNVHRLIEWMKYKGKQKVGLKLGELMGQKIADNKSFFENIDLIIPVPLHKSKLQSRGYNQCDLLAQGISEITQIPWKKNVLTRKIGNITQTKKTKYERWENVEGIFELKVPSEVENKHILLVDDVVTTGSTIESACNALQQNKNCKISVFTLATASK